MQNQAVGIGSRDFNPYKGKFSLVTQKRPLDKRS